MFRPHLHDTVSRDELRVPKVMEDGKAVVCDLK